MSTKQLYEKTSEGMKEVSPLVAIEDIYSKISDTPLEALVSLYNHVKCEWKGSVADTRRTVPLFLRRSGLFITYNNGTKYITEFFSAGTDQITTEGWVKDSNWTPVPDEDYISAGVKPGVGSIGYEQLNDNLKQLFREKVNVTNLPDDEDIVSVDNMLKLKDREADATNFQSKGYVILRKNLRLVNGVVKNILTQDMINQPNTIYEIRYDFDLDGKEITIQEGCTLKFEGGSLKNGKLLGFKHAQISNINNKTIFLDINIDLYNEGICQLEWFEHTEDDFSKALRLALKMFRRINLLNRQYTIRERNYELRTSTYIYGIANAHIYYDGDDVDVTNPKDVSSYLFHVLDYNHTTEYEGVTGGGFENIDFTTKKICNCIYSNCQGIFKNLAMYGFVRSIYITNVTGGATFDYFDGLLVSNVCTFPNKIIKDNTLEKPYDTVFEGMANTAHINHLLVGGLYVDGLFSCSISDSSVHKMFIKNSSVHFDGLHTEGPDRNDLYLSNSNVIIENSYLQFIYKSGLYISNDTILSYGNCGEMGVIIRNTIFSSTNDINENEPDYNININNKNWFHIILENVCYARRIDTPFLGVSGGIKIHFENKSNDFKNYYIDDLFNKHSIMYSKYCRFDCMNIFNSIRCVAPLYSSIANLERSGTSSDSRDIGDVYISVNYVFDLERKLYLSDNSFKKLDSNSKNSFRIKRIFRDDIIKLLTPEILVSYDNVNVAKRLIAPITAQYAQCYGNNIENYPFENIDIPISELSKKNIIEWGETIPQSKNVRFKLKSDSAPTFGAFRSGDECILNNYKHIYYKNSKWVDAIGADV